MINDYPCTCGHKKIDHLISSQHLPGCFIPESLNKPWLPPTQCYCEDFIGMCTKCWHIAKSPNVLCQLFKPDNLKYLEQCFEMHNSR